MSGANIPSPTRAMPFRAFAAHASVQTSAKYAPWSASSSDGTSSCFLLKSKRSDDVVRQGMESLPRHRDTHWLRSANQGPRRCFGAREPQLMSMYSCIRWLGGTPRVARAGRARVHGL